MFYIKLIEVSIAVDSLLRLTVSITSSRSETSATNMKCGAFDVPSFSIWIRRD